MKCRPSGRNMGHLWLCSKRERSGLVISAGVPPSAETRYSPTQTSGVKIITPSRFHVPPRPWGASHKTWADFPPDTSVFFSFPCEKKAMKRPSGDQNGCVASSVPGMTVACRLPTSYVQIRYLLACSEYATNATVRPSGDNAMLLLAMRNGVEKYIAGAAFCALVHQPVPAAMTASRSKAATSQPA